VRTDRRKESPNGVRPGDGPGQSSEESPEALAGEPGSSGRREVGASRRPARTGRRKGNGAGRVEGTPADQNRGGGEVPGETGRAAGAESGTPPAVEEGPAGSDVARSIAAVLPGGKGLLRAAERLWDSLDWLGLGRAAVAESVGLARHPVSTAGAVARYLSGNLVAAGATVVRALGGSAAGPMAIPPKDKRFSDRTWEENAFFFGLAQRHLLRERLLTELVEVANLDKLTAQKARLSSQLLADALAPTNFLWTNPAALRRTFESGGLSLLRGLRTWLDDLRQRQGWPELVDRSGFVVGRNLAATPGKVIHRNEVMELLEYTPQTPETFRIPLLCSPPWINKYYVMDLAPGRSFIEWAVKHGHRVFCLSYRNPDASMREMGLEDYLTKGPLEALRLVQTVTGARKVNLAGLCLGGTMATMLAAHLDAIGDDSLNSLTLINTLIDFSEPGPLGAFSDERTVAGILRRTKRRGYLESTEMAHTFNLLRANDLLFNYISSGRLMGQTPPAFDILAWNDDGTRIPVRFLGEYLGSCYHQNALARDALVIQGRRLAVSRLRLDTLIVGAVEDHITPWKSAFKATRLLAGPVRFLLTGSGHIAGIVNPPSKSTGYWTQERLDPSPEVWQAGATRHEESWWEEWSRWIDVRAGERKEWARTPQAPPPLMDAPGLYVLERA
jgi:polyhydroxyalkanoate synthase